MTNDEHRESAITKELRDTGLDGPVLRICTQFIEKFDWAHGLFPGPEAHAELLTSIENRPRIPEVTSLAPDLRNDHHVQAEDMEQVLGGIDQAIKLYAIFCVTPAIYRHLTAEIDSLDKIARAAKRLKTLLPRPGSALFGLLNFSAFSADKSKGPAQFDDDAARLNNLLDTLIQSKQALIDTKMGRAFGFGKATTKGNMALKLWMQCMHHIWTTGLSREFDYDGKRGVNGRKRFIDFCYNCLIQFDPRIEYHSIENLYRANPDCDFGL